MHTHMRTGLLALRSVRVLAAGAVAVALVSCSSILDVKNPNAIAESSLSNPAAASAMANGVLATTTRMLSGIAVPYAEATDELDWTGSRDAWLELDKGIIGNYLNEFTDGAFPYVGEARYLANSTLTRLEAFDAAGTLVDRTDLARTNLYTAIIYASIADMYDDYAFSSKTVAKAPVGRANMGQMYDSAVAQLNRAYTIATSANGASFVALRFPIMAYRARVKHAKAVWAKVPKLASGAASTATLVNDAGANADATTALTLATSDQKYTLTNNVEATAGINIWFEVNGRNESALGTYYKTLNDPVSGALDPTAQATLAGFTAMGSTSGTFTITSVREMRLILAESELAQGNTANFRTQLNTVRALDSKAAYAGAPVSDLAMLQHERSVQLLLMRRRLMDLYRFNLKPTKWVASPDASVEDSFRFNGLLFPIPNGERLSNPCIATPTGSGC